MKYIWIGEKKKLLICYDLHYVFENSIYTTRKMLRRFPGTWIKYSLILKKKFFVSLYGNDQNKYLKKTNYVLYFLFNVTNYKYIIFYMKFPGVTAKSDKNTHRFLEHSAIQYAMKNWVSEICWA